jgi:hypothetical protein
MKFTNKYNLPKVFERFEKANAHDKGDSKYSVSTLIDSPRVSKLKGEHRSEMSVDVSDQLFAILGTAAHLVLESGAGEGEVSEERFFADIPCGDGNIRVSGQVDLQIQTDEGVRICDFKTTSTYSILANPEGKQEWVKQLNCYAALARLNGVNVSSVEVIAICRDWSGGNRDRNPDYPLAPVVSVPLPMWREEVAYDYLVNRVSAHESDAIPQCTPEEMWAKPTTYAVYEQLKGGGGLKKRASKVYDNRTDAESHIIQVAGSQMEERKGVYTRCEGDYCSVSKWCDQYYGRIKRDQYYGRIKHG